ncbi:MAG: helix-turn-helix transcriptional regulator [Ruminococcus sp.]|nr:helix-turn-helix transcriptional regulator [Ruminococcus sp.]
MAFAERLEALRLAKGYSQAELAELVNISQPSYWAYEKGISIPHKNTQIQLARVLGVSVDELMKDDPKKDQVIV